MKNPSTSAPGSGPTIAPETALLAFRRKREAAGHSQIGLARLLGKSTAYVAHIENGRLNPSPSVRAELAALIGESAEVLFADFRTTKEEENAALGQRIVELYDAGASDAAIANLVEIGRGKAYSRRHAAGRTGRPNLATFRPPAGHLTAKAASDKYGLNCPRLCDAIDDGVVPGKKHDVAGSHPIRTVDEPALVTYLANRPKCAYDGCERQANIASKACSGAHARALETKGTNVSAKTRRAMSTAQMERHRHADRELERLNAEGYLNLRQVAKKRHVAPNTVSRWVEEGFLHAKPHIALRPLLLVSRDELARFNAEDWPRIVRHVGTRQLPHWSTLTSNRWTGRANGGQGAAGGIEAGRAKGGRTRDWPEGAQQEVLRLDREGRSSRDIAEEVFGDRRLYKRVQRFLNA